MIRSLRHRLPRLGRWARLGLAAGCVVLAALSATRSRAAARPAVAAGVPVVVASRALPAGHALSARDLSVHRLPLSSVPVGSRASPIDVTGRRLAGPVTAGEPITAGRVLGRGLLTGLPAGTLAVPVSIADSSTADLLHPGDRVDLVVGPPASDVPGASARGQSGGHVVATRLLVLACLRDSGSGTPHTALVVAADRATAVRIATAGASQDFAALGVSP